MQYNIQDIARLNRVLRLKIMNSVMGIKPTNLIRIMNGNGQTNLAISSSIMYLESNPLLLGFITRPTEEIPRHTYLNIQENGYYNINHIYPELTKL